MMELTRKDYRVLMKARVLALLEQLESPLLADDEVPGVAEAVKAKLDGMIADWKRDEEVWKDEEAFKAAEKAAEAVR